MVIIDVTPAHTLCTALWERGELPEMWKKTGICGSILLTRKLSRMHQLQNYSPNQSRQQDIPTNHAKPNAGENRI